MSLAMVVIVVGGLIAGIYQHDINRQAQELRHPVKQAAKQTPVPTLLDGAAITNLKPTNGAEHEKA